MFLCLGMHKNNFDSWHPRHKQLEKSYSLSSSRIMKIYTVIGHRQDLSRTVFELKFQDIAYRLSSNPILLYHGTKSDIMIPLPNASAVHHLHTKCKVCNHP